MRFFFVLAGWLSLAQAGSPDCDLLSLSGEKPSLRQVQAGKVLYLDFWASWCPSCARAFRFLNALSETFGPQGLLVAAVNLDEDPQDARAFLEQHPARFAVFLDPRGDCARAFEVEGMPAAYLIDRQGRVRYRHLGFRAADEAELKAKVEELLAESD
ncbi:TlpA family protein disulfide reductase [Methylothermus subterraneus]